MEDLKKKIAKFLAIGYGYGYGDGSGYGDGHGSGYGSGYGYGDGFGDVYGTGSGYGDVYGYVYAYGDGNFKEFCGHTVCYIDNIPTIIYSVNGNIAKGAILQVDFTIRDCYIAKVDNCFAHGKTAHKAFADAQAKALQNEPLETRIERFVAQYPDFDTKIAAQELFVWHHVLTGSCELGRLEFAKTHNINLETDKFTVREFVKLTENDYGGENIKLLAKTYSNG